MVAGVLVEITNKNVDKIFDYFVPSHLENRVKVGVRVLIPFGKMVLEGFVLEVKDSKTFTKELKDILDVVDVDVVLNEELLSLGKVIQKKTLASLISCYQVMLPKALKARHGREVSIRFDTFYCFNKDVSLDDLKLNDLQLQIVQLISEKKLVLRRDLCNISASSLKTLLRKGILKEVKKEHYRTNYDVDCFVKARLTSEQQNVVSQVINNPPQTYLLYGVTGAGKTEVYMEIIDYYLGQGKSAIMLVPEISLTPQMIQRFQKRFGARIAAIHSGLSDGERYDEWRRISRGKASIVIGARSAIFAPLKNIGIIIIDEEHSDSYKQSGSNPRYQAKDVASFRSKYHNCSIVLGSATPSLEAMARAQKGVYSLLELPHRVNGKDLPRVTIIDMNREMKNIKGHFSRKLVTAIGDCLSKREQIILLLNRRGYASFVMCKNCGYTFKCPNCDITLTYHKSNNILRCHYCGFGEKNYVECPKCREKALNSLGVGTQKIEEELKLLFPHSRILRMDYDTTSRKGMHEKMTNDFRDGKYDILLGTQMVAKGLDFSRVTLVGIINADTSLNIPDFRSSESTFSLLSQAAGRCGRSIKDGEVIIQTFNPNHYAISFTKNHDYFSFYKYEMNVRRQLKYPPYFYLCNLKISGRDSNYVLIEALKIKRELSNSLLNTIILGPSIAGVFKVNNIYRYNIILKYKEINNLYEVLSKIVDHYKSITKVSIEIDFDPIQIL